jgi:outer membrane protein assembly factor BamB
MSRALKWILASMAAALVVLAGAAGALWLTTRDRSQGALDTQLTDITVSSEKATAAARPTRPISTADRTCWPAFGGSLERTLSRPNLRLQLPPHKPIWTRDMGDLMEYPPTYCDGDLYVNLEHGRTVALDAKTGKVLWTRRAAGLTASSPAIAGSRLIVSSHGGTVTAFRRTDGKRLWQLRTDAAFESSPIMVDGVAFVGADDGRLFAIDVRSGKPRWVYALGGRISSSPSVIGANVCITTYSGAVGCFRRATGERVWLRYFRRDAFRYESFYASASSDRGRVFTVARTGKVLALDARTGGELWEAHTGALTYGTPAVSDGRVFVGDLGGHMWAFRATDGKEIWETSVRGRVLGPSLVVGKFVFFSTLESRTYAARITDGKIVWQIPMGKYAPGIATERRYYLSLNGRLAAYDGSSRAPS